MNLIKLTTGAVLAGAILVNSAGVVLAQGLTQEQKQKLEQELNLELECTAGAYGFQTCRAKGNGRISAEQEQRAKLVYNVELIHEPVNAGLDSKTLLAISLIMIAGVAGAAYQVRSKMV